jgi:plastocyanin
MRRLALALSLAAALALAVPAPAQMMMDHAGTGPHVSILFGDYAPAQIDVVAGDTVTWTNDSVRNHTVSATDTTWSSAHLAANESYSFRFDTPGAQLYYCQLHGFMRGEVDVHQIIVDPPREPGAPGRHYGLTGRSSLGAGTTLTIERDTGSGFQPVGTATVDPTGAFKADVVPSTTAAYRAVAGDEVSPPVQLLVLDRRLAAAAATHGRTVNVSASVAPASPGANVVLQLRLHNHFGWWPVARARLDRASHARLTVRLRQRVPARVVLTLADGATPLAVSATMRVGIPG